MQREATKTLASISHDIYDARFFFHARFMRAARQNHFTWIPVKDEIWNSRALVQTACDVIAKFEGWETKYEKRNITCNRHGNARVRSIDGEAHSKLIKGCKWKLVLSPLVRTSYVSSSSNPDAKRPNQKSYKDEWDKPVKISSISPVDTNGCIPSRANRIAVVQASGNFKRKIPMETLFQLCSYVDEGLRLSHQTIKCVITPIWPKHKQITGQDTFYIRLKVMKARRHFHNANKEYNTFKEEINSCDLLNGIDDQCTLDDDDAYELAHQLCEEVVRTSKNDTEAIFSFQEYLALIAERATGFSYQVVSERRKNETKLLGVFWMTATMRRNYELFGSFLCFDMMKRDINTLLWPYTAVTMLDEAKQVCVVCEGIVSGERLDMYAAQSKFLSKFAPSRPLSMVDVIAADGFFDQLTVRKLGFENARFIQDHFHLYDSGLLKIFGKSGYEQLQSHLVQMIKAQSESRFNEVYQSGLDLLSNDGQTDGELLGNFKKFSSRKEEYAEYCIAMIPGNRGCRGSPTSEANHSSVLSYLNNGSKGINRYREHPIFLVKDLLLRQQAHLVKVNARLYRSDQLMSLELTQLEKNPNTHLNTDLQVAAGHLNHETYLRYKSNSLRACLYDRQETLDESTGKRMLTIQFRDNPDAPPRVFHVENGRCNCKSRIAEQDMCVHEIVGRKGFQPEFFQLRHFSRKCVSGSLDGWEPPSRSVMDEVIGYTNETLDRSIEVSARTSSVEDTLKEMTSEENPYITTTELTRTPVGHIPDRRTGINPYSKKDVENVLQAVLIGYPKMPQEKQYDISMLVLQMQNLLTESTTKSVTLESQEGSLSLNVPLQHTLLTESKKREKVQRK